MNDLTKPGTRLAEVLNLALLAIEDSMSNGSLEASRVITLFEQANLAITEWQEAIRA